MITIEKHNESFLKIKCDVQIASCIRDYFTFFVDKYQFNPKYKAGIWDGKISLYDIRTRLLPIGLYDRLITFLSNNDLEYKITFKQPKNSISPSEISDFISSLNTRLEPRNYQINGIVRALNEMKCGILLPTSSGKSFLQYVICKYLLKKNPDFKILMIVPTVGLVEQMKYDFVDYCDKEIENDIHLIYSGKNKITDKSITISTWQSLNEIEINNDNNPFEQYDVVLVDECHLAAAKCISSIINSCVNAKYKCGFSGTLQDSKVSLVQLEGLFGQFENTITTKQLMDKGYVTKLKINSIVLKYDKEDVKQYKSELGLINKQDNKAKYELEVKIIKENKKRNKLILKMISKLNGNCLVLFRHVKYGKELAEKLSEMNPNRNVFLVYGDIKAEERERIRLCIENESDAILVGSESILSTGINIPKLNYLIFAQVTKSQVRVLQSIGRLLRKHESKTRVVVYDIVDYLKSGCFSVKHGTKRYNIYRKEQFDSEVKTFQL